MIRFESMLFKRPYFLVLFTKIYLKQPCGEYKSTVVKIFYYFFIFETVFLNLNANNFSSSSFYKKNFQTIFTKTNQKFLVAFSYISWIFRVILCKEKVIYIIFPYKFSLLVGLVNLFKANQTTWPNYCKSFYITFFILQNIFQRIWKIQQETIKNIYELRLSENFAKFFTVNCNCRQVFQFFSKFVLKRS